MISGCFVSDGRQLRILTNRVMRGYDLSQSQRRIPLRIFTEERCSKINNTRMIRVNSIGDSLTIFFEYLGNVVVGLTLPADTTVETISMQL